MSERARCPHCGAWRPGRPRINDAAALRLARTLLASGGVRSKNQALRRAAALLADGDLDSAARRLWRKF